jgi:1,4-dihydroxy-2-naphthoyl-CoA hydrolase
MKKRIQKIIEEGNDHTIFKTLGLIIEKLDQDETIVSLKIDNRHYQPMGLVHGGVYVVMAESAASLAAACTLTQETSSVVGLEINANHVRSAKSGILRAYSRCLHHGRRTLVYEVRVQDSEESLISIARCTLMVIEKD